MLGERIHVTDNQVDSVAHLSFYMGDSFTVAIKVKNGESKREAVNIS